MLTFGLGTKHEHALNYVFIQRLLGALGLLKSMQFRSLTLSFISPTTSGRDIKDTLSVGTILEQEDLDRVWLKEGDVYRKRDPSNRPKFKDTRPAFGLRHHGSENKLKNIWELLDWCLCRFCDVLPSFREVVIEVKASSRAQFEVRSESVLSVSTSQNSEPEPEPGIHQPSGCVSGCQSDGFGMGVEEFDNLVKTLLPKCQAQKFEVKAVLGLDTRVSGIWENCRYGG
ncbi:hypothetical protein BDN72DRAFT_838854, partial [Pluteus cervinus]